MICKFFLVILILHTSFFLYAETDSCNYRLSILTCSPGKELYSTFGHSALRLTDSVMGEDIVFNYGTFDFNEPGFYTKFIRGKLTFYLSMQDFESFVKFYKEEKRGITEQVLNLNCTEKNRIVQFLHNNLDGQNKFYKYDFTFDNCTTRLRDIIEKTADSSVHFPKIIETQTTFRDLIYKYLDYSDKQWSKLGIDILLGSKMDASISNRQAMFLPDYLLKSFDNTFIDSRKLMLSKSNLYENNKEKVLSAFYESPAFIFNCVFIIIFFLGLSKQDSLVNFLNGFDGFFFFTTGLLGFFLIFMWLATDHVMCKNNYNLLWAWPFHSIAAFFINSKKETSRIYFKITAILTTIVLITWFFLPQHMNPSLIPLVILIIYRSTVHGFKLI